MSTSTIRYTQDDRVVTIRLNRPERRNALDATIIRELTEALGLANRIPQVRVVVLTGEGDAFCSGMDLEYLIRTTNLAQEEILEDAKNLARLLQVIASLRKIVIAQVNGAAIGGGCGLAAACDFVLAGSGKAKIGAPEVRLGFVPAVILPYLIARMGAGAAKEFVLQGSVLDARTASERGLVTEVVPDDSLEETVRTLAGRLATSVSSSSVTLTKDLFVRFQEMNPKDAIEYGVNINALARKTDDFRKGIESMIRKEKPEW